MIPPNHRWLGALGRIRDARSQKEHRTYPYNWWTAEVNQQAETPIINMGSLFKQGRRVPQSKPSVTQLLVCRASAALNVLLLLLPSIIKF